MAQCSEELDHRQEVLSCSGQSGVNCIPVTGEIGKYLNLNIVHPSDTYYRINSHCHVPMSWTFNLHIICNVNDIAYNFGIFLYFSLCPFKINRASYYRCLCPSVCPIPLPSYKMLTNLLRYEFKHFRAQMKVEDHTQGFRFRFSKSWESYFH